MIDKMRFPPHATLCKLVALLAAIALRAGVLPAR